MEKFPGIGEDIVPTIAPATPNIPSPSLEGEAELDKLPPELANWYREVPPPAMEVSPPQDTGSTLGNIGEGVVKSFEAFPGIVKQTAAATKMTLGGDESLSQVNMAMNLNPFVAFLRGQRNLFDAMSAQRPELKDSAAYNLVDTLAPDYVESQGPQYGVDMDAAKQQYIEASREIAGLRPENTAGKITFDVLTNAQRMFPSIAVGTVTKNPNLGLGLMYGQVYADKTAELTAAGVDPDVIPMHAKMSATIETLTEKLPMDILIKNIGWSAIKKLLGFTVIEGAQEGVNSLIQSAWDKGTIKPEMTLQEALKAAGYDAIVGTLSGPVVAGPSIAYQKWADSKSGKQLIQELPDLESQVKKAIEDGKIQGPFMPQDMQDKLREMNQIEGEAEQEVLPGLTREAEQLLRNASVPIDEAFVLYDSTRPNPTKWTDVIKQAIPNYRSDAPAGTVDSSMFGNFQENLDALRNEYNNTKDLMMPDQRIAAASEITMMQKLAEIEKEVGPKAASILKDLVKEFAPDMRIYLGDHKMTKRMVTAKVPDIVGNFYGRHIPLHNNDHLIQLDLRHMVDSNGVIDFGKLKETLSHEFGHALIYQEFQKLPKAIQNKVKAAYINWLNKAAKVESLEKFNKMRHGFFWNKKMGDQSYKEFGRETTLQDLVTLLHKNATNTIDNTVGPLKDFDPGLYNKILADKIREVSVYEFGMNEFVAIQAEKILNQKEAGDTETRQFYKRVNDFLKKFYNRYKEEYGIQSSYQDYLRYLQAKQSYRAAQEMYNELRDARDSMTEEEVLAENVGSVINAINKGPVSSGAYGQRPRLPSSAYTAEEFQGDLDRYNKVIRYGTTLLQLRKLNPHITGLQKYTDIVKDWWNTKMQWTARADDRLKQWKKLGGKRADRFGKFMLDLTVMSYEEGKKFTPQDVEFQRLAERWKLQGEEIALFDLVTEDFNQVLNELQETLIADARRQFEGMPDELSEALTDLQKQFTELRNLNFFPLSRFGDYFVRGIAQETFVLDGKTYKPGDMVSFETFESEGQMKKRLRASGNQVKYEGGVLSDTQKQFSGLPPQMIGMLKNRLNLTEEQQMELSQLLHDIAPGQSFRKHMKQRKNVKGFSQDAVRGYANYFMHFSNHIARVRYKWPLLDAINEVRDSADTIRRRNGEAVKRDRIKQHLDRHYEYIMDPGNELANLRALGFLWYLGFVPKSAFVNLTQVPLVTYPYLAARYGDGAAVAALAKATNDAKNIILRPQRLTEGQVAMLETLKQTGIIDESMATELAATSEGSILQRMAPGTFLKSEFAGRLVRDLGGKAAWMFQQAEKVNRRITALAAYNLARKNGANHEQGVEAAQDAVESTQFEYARWNRAEFMQRKKSVFFLFWQYKQNALYFAMQDPGASRYLLMMFLMAGLSGLPFAEDAMDIYDWLAKKMNKWFGGEDLNTNVRVETRKFIAELGMNPDLVMHGSSRYMFGMPALGDAIGIPIPNMDISGSLSMGRMIPGIDPVFGREGEFDERFAKAAQETLGAVAAMPIQLMRAIADDNPDTLKRFEKAMPSFARNVSKAYRYARDEAETDPSGARLEEFDLEDSYHKAEIIGQALGFAPTRLQEEKEKYYAIQEVVRYYEVRRQMMMQNLFYAREKGDALMEEDVRDEITKFNKSVPYPLLRIGPADIKRSLQGRIRDRVLKEKGEYTTKKGVQIQWDVESAFPGAVSEEEVP